MERQDFELGEFMVPEALGLPLHGFNLVIGAFQGTGGNGVIIVGQESHNLR